MRSLRITRGARSDIAAITVFVASESGSRHVARGFAAKIRQRCEQLASLPGTMGRDRSELKPGLRSATLGNYVIFFRYVDAVLEVVSVLEGHQDIERGFDEDAD